MDKVSALPALLGTPVIIDKGVGIWAPEGGGRDERELGATGVYQGIDSLYHMIFNGTVFPST